MKKFLLIIVAALSLQAYGQINYVDVIPTYGYHFGGRAYFYEGDIKVDNAATYGITLSAPIGWNVSGEFSWSRSDSKMKFYPKRPDYYEDEQKVSSNYFLIGAVKEVGESSLKGFGGFSLGLAWFDFRDSALDDDFRFSISFIAGAKYMISKRIGIRVQGRFLIPLYFGGAGMYCGIGGGGSSCGVGVSGGTTIFQGDISGGLIIRIGATE